MLLKRGDNNENVRQMQIKLGIQNPVTNFGPKTEEAVKEFQRKHGLAADGIVGPKTWAMIMGESTSQSQPAPKVEIKYDGPLKIENLRGHIPEAVLSQIPDTVKKFELNTPLRLAHFLAQCGHESNGFKAVRENLNYSAKGLMGIFKKYFPTEAIANQYARQPEKIANKVYANRMSNGTEASGDGFNFRGRGYIQLTGRDNYTAFGKAIGENISLNPDKVATDYPLLSAAWFFHKNGLHKIADQGSTDAVVTTVTKRVNGGTIGLADRIKHFKEYYHLLK